MLKAFDVGLFVHRGTTDVLGVMLLTADDSDKYLTMLGLYNKCRHTTALLKDNSRGD